MFRTGLRLAGTTSLLACLAAPALAQEAPPPRSTTDQVLDSAGRIVTQPMRDLNVKQDEIPPALTAIMADPYSLKGLATCADYAAEIAKLTKVIGPDVDSPEAKKAGQTSAEFVLGTAEAVAGSLIPGSGIIRRVSGADAARKRTQAAVLAGQLRRAFLKGRASGKGCRA